MPGVWHSLRQWFFIRSALAGLLAEPSGSIDACISPLACTSVRASLTHSAPRSPGLELKCHLWAGLTHQGQRTTESFSSPVVFHVQETRAGFSIVRTSSLASRIDPVEPLLVSLTGVPLCQNQLHVQAQSWHGRGLPRAWPWQTESLGLFFFIAVCHSCERLLKLAQ